MLLHVIAIIYIDDIGLPLVYTQILQAKRVILAGIG